MTKPSGPVVWATTGPITVPSSDKQSAGFGSEEKPACEFINWNLNLLGLWTAWLDTGDVEFDSVKVDTTLEVDGVTTVHANVLPSTAGISVGTTGARFGTFAGNAADLAASGYNKVLSLTGDGGLVTEYVSPMGHYQALGLRVFDDFAGIALDPNMWVSDVNGGTIPQAQGTTGERNAVLISAETGQTSDIYTTVTSNSNATFDPSAHNVAFRCRFKSTSDYVVLGFGTVAAHVITPGITLSTQFVSGTVMHWFIQVAGSADFDTGIAYTTSSTYNYLSFWTVGTTLYYLFETTPDSGTPLTHTITTPTAGQYDVLMSSGVVGSGHGIFSNLLYVDSVDAWADGRPA